MPFEEGFIGLRATMGPLRRTTVPLQPGLNALYGLNGAGKSSILDAFRAALTGVLEHPDDRPGRRHVALFFKADEHFSLLGGGSDLGGFLDLDYEDAVGSLMREVLKSWFDPINDLGLENLGLEPLQFGNLHELGPLAQEIAEQRVIALIPTGLSEPSWQVWLCAHPTVETPRQNKSVRVLERQRLSLLEPYMRCVQDGDDDWEPFRIPANALAVHPLIPKTGPIPGGSHSEYMGRWLELHNFVNSSWFDIIIRLNEGIAHSLDEDWPELLPFWYDGFPVPVAKLITLERLPWGLLDSIGIDQTMELTRRVGSERVNSLDDLTDLGAWCDDISESSNGAFSRLLLDAPPIRLTVGSPGDWVRGSSLKWSALDHGNLLGLHELSTAEQRWASIAITRAAYPPGEAGPAFWLLDEPEAALHRSAEEHMARGLASTAQKGECWLIATHSPPLLDNPNTNVLRVRKTPDGTRVTPLTRADMAHLDDLGLHPSDLLRRWRVILLVEGHHEEIIFEEVLGNQFHAARVHVLPIDGVGQLAATVDSRLLWDFTDASIIAVVDNERAAKLDSVWEQAWNLDALEGTGPAVDFIGKKLSKKEGFETQAMRKFLSLAIAKGRPTYTRIRPFAFTRPDITDYLPVSALLPEHPKKTWDELRIEHDAQSRAGQAKRPFKAWMQDSYGKRLGRTIFTEEAIRSAASQLEEMPDEFQLLLNRCLTAGPPPAED